MSQSGESSTSLCGIFAEIWRYNIDGGIKHILQEVLSCVLSRKSLPPPFVLLLSLVLAVLTLPHSLATGVLSILALIAACGVLACTIGRDPASGIRVLIMAAFISPFRLPALSEWLTLKPGDLKYALQAISGAATLGQFVPK